MRRSIFQYLFLTYLSCCVDPLAAQWQVFDMATAGLPSNTVNALANGENGEIWVGTDWGLCKYNGTTWEVIQVSNSDIPENDIRAIAVDAQGRVWVGFFTQGLAVFDGSGWQHYSQSDSPLPSQTVRQIEFDQEGYAWLATTNGVVRTDLNEWRIYDNSETSYNNLILPGNNIADLAVRNDGLISIGTLNAGIVYLTDSSVTVFSTTLTGLPDNTGLGIALSPNGDRWVACPIGGLLHNFGDHLSGFWSQYYTQNSSIPSNALNDIIIDQNDRKIIATQQAGIAIFSNDDSWQVFNVDNSGLPDNEIRTLLLDSIGGLWVGTGTGGAARLSLATLVPETGSWGFNEIELYPIPTNKFLNYGPLLTNEPTVLSILDLSGRRIQQFAVFERFGMLDVSKLTPGVYLFEVSRSNYLQTKRFVVQ